MLHVAQPDAVLSYVVLGMHLHFSVPRHYITSSPSVHHRLDASRTLHGASDLLFEYECIRCLLSNEHKTLRGI